jgi:carbonic anhydrase
MAGFWLIVSLFLVAVMGDLRVAPTAAPTLDSSGPPNLDGFSGASATTTKTEEPATSDASKKSADQDKDTWSYGKEEEAKWAKRNKAWALCGSGTQQSPIDVIKDKLILAKHYSIEPLMFNYMHTDAAPKEDVSTEGEDDDSTDDKKADNTLENTGFGVQLSYEKGSSLRTSLNGEVYGLETIRFVAPSEHTVQGRAYAMEAQLIHLSEQNNRLIVSVMYDVGMESEFLDSLGWGSLPSKGGKHSSGKSINALDAIPFGRNYWSYKGSMTYPPCTENVAWYIMSESQQMSVAQLKDLQNALGSPNSRGAQKLNGRHIYSSSDTLDSCFGSVPEEVKPLSGATGSTFAPAIAKPGPAVREHVHAGDVNDVAAPTSEESKPQKQSDSDEALQSN